MDLLIRPATTADAAGIRAVYAPAVLGTPASFEAEVPSADELARRMLAGPRRPWLVAEAPGGEIAGYAYAGRHRERAAYRWSAESSVYLAPAYQGRGLGRRLYERLITEARDLGYVSLFAGITLPNPASVALHEAVGFRPAGVFPAVGYKLGSWHDVGWWVLPLHPSPPPDPAEPRPWNP